MQPEINFNTQREIGDISEEELLLMRLGIVLPGYTIPYGLISYKRGLTTGTKQQHTSSFDKHFETNLSKDCVTEIENQSNQKESGQ